MQSPILALSDGMLAEVASESGQQDPNHARAFGRLVALTAWLIEGPTERKHMARAELKRVMAKGRRIDQKRKAGLPLPAGVII